jgi:hypothetical protein
MGGNSEQGPFEGLMNMAVFYGKTGIGKKISKATGGALDKALGMQPPDMKDVDALYMAQAKDTEGNIKAMQLAEANKRKLVRGVRSGGGSSTQGIPTLTSIGSTPKSGAQSLFGDQ